MAMAQKLPSGRHRSSVEAGGDTIASCSFSRWDVEAPLRGSANVVKARFGSWLPNIDLFDAALFGINSNEADLMDPQQRLLLEVRPPSRSTPYCHRSAHGSNLLRDPVLDKLARVMLALQKRTYFPCTRQRIKHLLASSVPPQSLPSLSELVLHALFAERRAPDGQLQAGLCMCDSAGIWKERNGL